MKKWRKCLFAAALVALMLLAAAGSLVWSGMNDQLGKADLALVLGNQVNPDGTPSPRLKARLDQTLDLYRAGYFSKILVSGGTGKEGVAEGTAMKRYLVAAGIPDEQILVDDQGVDTMATAVNTCAILKANGWKSVMVITQYFHVPRTRMILGRMEVSPVYHAHARYFEARDLYSIFRELPAYLKYRLRALEDS